MNHDEFITQVLSTIDEADVLTIFFPNLSKELVVDTRASKQTDALIRILNQANTMEERMRAVEKMRPRLGPVKSIAGIPWTKSIRTLQETDVLGRLERRLINSGFSCDQAQLTCEDVFKNLLKVEHAQWTEVIIGSNSL